MLIGKRHFQEVTQGFIRTKIMPKAITLRGDSGIGKKYCCDWLAGKTSADKYFLLQENNIHALSEYNSVNETSNKYIVQIPEVDSWDEKNQFYLSQQMDLLKNNVHLLVTYTGKITHAIPSRSLNINMPPARNQDIIVYLTQNLNYDGPDAMRLARLCQGNIGKLMSILNSDTEEKVKLWNNFLRAVFSKNYISKNFEAFFKGNPEESFYDFLRIWKAMLKKDGQDVYLLYDVYLFTKKALQLYRQTKDYAVVDMFLENIYTIIQCEQPLDRKKLINGI